jgi:hypothetical protein
MADASASFVVNDPSQDSWGQDITVRTGRQAPPPPAPPIGPDSAGPSQAGSGGAPTVYYSNEDIFGPSAKSAPANSNGSAPAPQAGKASAPAGMTPAAVGNDGTKYFSNDQIVGDQTASGPLGNTGNEGWLSGLGKGAATAAIKGLADIPGYAGNLAGLTDYLLARGQSAITGEDPNTILQRFAADRAQIKSDQQRNLGVAPGIDLPSGQDIAAPILAKTGSYDADTTWGRMGQAGLEGVISMMGPGGGSIAKGATAPEVLSTVARTAAPVAVSTGVGQRVGEVTGDPLLGMAAGGAAGAGLDALGRTGLGGQVPAVREQNAARRLLSGAQDKQGLMDWANGNVPDGASTPVVPGSKPTLGQLTGDNGILRQEQAARNVDGDAFAERDAEQDAARQAQIDRQAPADADVMAAPELFADQRDAAERAGQFAQGAMSQRADDLRGQLASQAPANADVMRAPGLFRARRDRIDQAAQNAVKILTQRAQAAAEKLDPGMTPESRGNAIRTALDAMKRAARDAKSQLYDAVDPGNRLNIVAQPVREAAQRIAKDIDPLDEQPEARERDLFKAASSIPDVLPFQRLRALDRNVTGAMIQERRTNGESTAYRRLVQLKGAVQDAIDHGVENQMAYEAAGVARGDMRPEDTIAYRLAQAEDAYGSLQPDKAFDAARVSNRANALPGEVAGEGPELGARGDNATRQTASPRRSAQGNSGVPSKAGSGFLTETPPRSLPRTRFLEHLAARGGLKPTPELEQIFGKGVNPVLQTSAGARRLFNAKGMSLDDAFQAAKEGGYAFDAADVERGASQVNGDNHVLDLIDRDNVGEEIRPQGDIGERDFEYLHAMRNAEQRVRADLKANGIDPAAEDRDVLQRTIDLVADPESRMDPMDAHERATMDLARGRAREGGLTQEESGHPEFAPRGDEAEPLTPNFDPAAAGRLRAANKANREYSGTYREGPVARVIATGGLKDNYKMLDASVPGAAVPKGDKGYQTVKAFLKASGNSPEAIGAMADHLVQPLRDLLPDTAAISPSKFASWKRDYGPAIRAMDEVVPGFSKQFDDAAKATDALFEAGRLRQEAMDKFEKSEAGKFIGGLGKNEPSEVEAAVGKILSDETAGPTRMEALVKAAESDPEAIAGLRKAGVDWMLRKFSTAKDANGEPMLSGKDLRTFLSKSRTAVGKLYGSSGLGNIAAIASELARADGGAIGPIEEFKRSAPGKFLGSLGKTAPSEVENSVGAVLSDKAAGPTRMEELVKAASADPKALDGLRRAGVNWMRREYANGPDSPLDAKRFTEFLAGNRTTVAKLYGSEGLGQLAAVARDMGQSDQKAPASGGHAIKGALAKAGHAAGHPATIFSALAFGHEALGIDLHSLPHVAAGAGVGLVSYFLNTLRSAGLEKTNALVRDALLNPERARLLLSKLPEKASSGKWLHLARLIRREILGAPTMLPKQGEGR